MRTGRSTRIGAPAGGWPAGDIRGHRGVQWLLFAVAFLAFAWFHQGGGWNQNARFALVRSIVEGGHLWIDDFLVYAGTPGPEGTRLVRLPVRDGAFTHEGRTFALYWRDAQGEPIRLAGAGAGGGASPVLAGEVTWVEPERVACTGDLSFHGGHLHPAKAPGTSFAAVPAYALIHAVVRMAGLDPDAWSTLTITAWLTSVLSVGLLAALGSVLLYRFALDLSGGRAMPSLLAALTFAFGTMFFPYATALYEHDVVAVAVLASFYLLFRVKEGGEAPDPGRAPVRPLSARRVRTSLALAGFAAGWAAITNFVMAAVVLLLLGYLLLGVRRRGGWIWFGLGLLGPFLLICAYNVACFSTPFTTNYRYENPVFQAGGGWLGVFLAPRWEVVPAVLVSPYRGLFVSSPALLLGVYGLVSLRRGHRAEAVLAASVLAFFLLFATAFNGWDGGWAVGPRYLMPAVPFLALAAVKGFVSHPRLGGALAAVSVAIQLLVTAVDPQSPVGNARSAMVEGRPQWAHSPITEWELPLFVEERAWPLLRAQRDAVLRAFDSEMQAAGQPVAVREGRLADLSARIDADIRAGLPAPLLVERSPSGELGLALSDLPTFAGPVSVSPMGVYEAWVYRVFPPGSREAHGNSFNAGEIAFPRSRWSLAPLLAVAAALVALALREASRLDRRRP